MTRFLTVAVFLACVAHAPAQQWGTVKGQIVWGSAAVPKREEVSVATDKEHCLSKGKLLKDELLIDPKTNGIKDVLIWLEPVDKTKPLPIHPDLKAIPKTAVEIDQPCCQFVPRVVAIRAGQTLIIKNSASVSHSAKLIGNGQVNKEINSTIPAGQKLEFSGDKALKAEPKPLMLGCAIHGWMGGKVGVYDHPYFAVTAADGTFEIKNAPAGEIIIKMMHDRGWVHPGGTGKGHKVTIPADGTRTLDLGKIKVQ
jgi:hypothetical protein